MTTRRMMIAVAAVALILGGVISMNELDRRADFCRKKAEYHRRREEILAAQAAYLESTAQDLSNAVERPSALDRTMQSTRGQALEMELEVAFGSPSVRRSKPTALDAGRDALQKAQASRRESRSHARQRKRYERVAIDPWLPLEPESAVAGP
jgi:hypothetical protein